MLPVTSHQFDPAARTLRADAFLQSVLRGEAHLLFDGAMGTMLQAAGLEAGEIPELLCLTDPEAVTAIHAQYVAAGAQVVTANTFGANARKLGGAATVDEIFAAAIRCARASGARYVAADIGPTGALLEPLGTLSFDEAYDLFAEQVRAAQAHGADMLVIETMADLLEIKAAVLAAKEHSDLPIFATMTFGEDGRTFLGTSPQVAALTLGSLGVDVLGVNCSLGPDELHGVVEELLEAAPCPVMVQANAGLPKIEGGVTTFSVTPEAYAASVARMVDAGVVVVGGCCGTSPEFIKQLAALLEGRTPAYRPAAPACAIASAQQAVVLQGRAVATIGERINPTGKKRLKEALRTGDFDYVVGEAISQTEAGVDILDVNAGLPEIDEAATLVKLVGKIQSVSPLPLQIDSSDPAAVEAAVRVYAGKPLINSVNGKAESLEAVLPLARHYGCAVVGLTLDESGIPPTAEERFAIAKRIVEAAQHYGIPREDVFIDCLVMAASTNQAEVVEILRAITLVKERLGVRTVLGVSNVSFGLPLREVVNATFLAAAFAAGLDMPILNPLAVRYAEVVDTWRVLCGQDASAQRYIEAYAPRAAAEKAAKAACGAVPVNAQGEGVRGTGAARDVEIAPCAPRESHVEQMSDAKHAGAPAEGAVRAPAQAGQEAAAAGAQDLSAGGIQHLVITGRKPEVARAVENLLEQGGACAMDVIDKHLIPALDEVSRRFEAGTFFLPQLMASAEAAKAGFDVIRKASGAQSVASKGALAIATVKGDIHDIGKNIVRMLLENYGYTVYDLGRDVQPEAVLACVQEHDLKLVGLSALMTTTVRGMEETIALLRAHVPEVKIFVGGAVLTPEYAAMVGADYYAKDAAEGARIAAEVLG